MTHHGPCDLFHDPDVRPRLTVRELATVDDVVRWAQRRQDGSETAGVHGYRIEAADAARVTTAGWRGTVDEEMTA